MQRGRQGGLHTLSETPWSQSSNEGRMGGVQGSPGALKITLVEHLPVKYKVLTSICWQRAGSGEENSVGESRCDGSCQEEKQQKSQGGNELTTDRSGNAHDPSSKLRDHQ